MNATFEAVPVKLASHSAGGFTLTFHSPDMEAFKALSDMLNERVQVAVVLLPK